MNVNKAIIVGRLTRDPEVRTTPNGQTVTNFTIATSTTWKDQNGQPQERTEFHNVVAWGRRGEVIGQYVTKGQELYVEGRLETRSWDDQETGKKMYRTEIILENFEFGQRPNNTSANYDNNYSSGQTTQQNTTPQQQTQPQDVQKQSDSSVASSSPEVNIADVPF